MACFLVFASNFIELNVSIHANYDTQTLQFKNLDKWAQLFEMAIFSMACFDKAVSTLGVILQYFAKQS